MQYQFTRLIPNNSNNMKVNLFNLLLFSTFPFWLFSQNPTQNIKGTILDRDTRQPLIGATIVALNTDPPIGTITDIDGQFLLENVPVGRQQVECQYLGYQPYVSEPIILNSAKELTLNIELTEAVIQTEEIVVKAFKHSNEPLNDLSMVSTRSFSVEETQRYAASANDPSRMALGFPGVQPSRDARSDIIIRGNAAFGLLWRLEGIDIPNPNHFARKGSSGGGITIFSVSMLSNSDFCTGAFAAEYGNAFSGVFDIRFRNGNKERREYTIRAGMLGLDFSTEGPIKNGKSSYLVNYRYSTLGILDAMNIRLVSERESNRFQDLSFKLNFTSSNNRHLFSIWGLGGVSDEFEEAVEGIENWKSYTDYYTRDFDTDMGAVGLNHTWLIDDKSFLSSNLAVMGQKILLRNDTLNTQMISTNVNDELYLDNRLTYNATYRRKFSPKTTMKAGVTASLMSYDLHWKYLIGDEFETFLDEKGNTSYIQSFANLRIRPNAKWTINAGLHALFFQFNNTQSIEPRLGMQYQLNDRNSISLAYGLHSRILPMGSYLTRLYTSEGNLIQPNRDLELLKAHHLVLAYDYLFGDHYRLRVEGYLQKLFNVQVGTRQGSTYAIINEVDNFSREALANEGKATNVGVDLTLEKFFSNGTFFLATTSVFNSTFEPLDGKKYNTRFNSNVFVSFMGGKEWPIKEKAVLQTGIRLLYSGGGRQTPILSAARDPFDPLEPILDESQPFTERVPDYFRPDLRIAYRKNNPASAWSIALDVQNFIARDNVDTIQRKFDPDLGQWIYREQSGIVPVLSFQLDF